MRSLEMKKLYVGNLPYSVDEDQLNDIFAGEGNVVSAKLITDRDSGRSKGFGFVEYENEEDADRAIENLNGSEVDGRTITVNVAKEKTGGGGGGRRGGGGGGRGGRDFRGGGGGGGRGGYRRD